MSDFGLTTRHDGAIALVTLAGNFDADHAPCVRQALAALCDREQPVVFVLMAELSGIDSAGLGVLYGALKQASARVGGRVVLVQPSPYVSRILRVTSLDKVFSVYADEAEARAASLQ